MAAVEAARLYRDVVMESGPYDDMMHDLQRASRVIHLWLDQFDED